VVGTDYYENLSYYMYKNVCKMRSNPRQRGHFRIHACGPGGQTVLRGVLLVFAVGYPFQIGSVIVLLVSISVVDLGLAVWVIDVILRHKSVQQ
jgi:hypothetical protein